MRFITTVLLSIFVAASAVSPKNGLASQLEAAETPVITGISPDNFASGINMPVTISGSNFENIASVTLGEIALTDIELVAPTQLSALVPWSILPGEYDLTLTKTTGESGVLPDAVMIDPVVTDWASNGPYGGALTDPSIDPKNPARIYVGAQRSGFFFTTDGAENWTMERIAPFPGKVHFVYAAGATTPTMYMDGSVGIPGLQRSTDNGATWQTKMPFWYDGSGITIRAAVDDTQPDLVYLAVLEWGNDPQLAGVYLSTNQGDWWNQFTATAGLQVRSIAVEPGNINHLAIGTEDGYVLTSTDGGTNRSAAVLVDADGDPDALTDIDRLVISPFQVNGIRRIWALSSYTDWAYYSEDDGATWTPKTIQMSGAIYDLEYHDTIPGLLWAAVGGTYYSTDDGDTWTALNGDIGEVNHFALVAGASTRAETTIFAASVSGMFKSTNGGDSWIEKDQGIGAALPGAIVVSPFNADEAYAAIIGKGLQRTVDGGTTWQKTIIPNSYYRVGMAADPFTRGKFYFSKGQLQASPEVYVTEDHANTYATYTITLPASFVSDERAADVNAIAANPDVSGSLLAGLGLDWKYGDWPEGLIYASSDSGATWTQQTTPAGTKSISSIVYDPQDANKVYAGTQDGLLVSTDGGANWTAPANQPDVTVVGTIVVDPRDSNSIYLFGGPHSDDDINQDAGTFATHDGGATWVKLEGLTHYPVWELKIVPVNDQYWIYAATMNGLFFLRDIPAGDFDPYFTWEASSGIAGVATVDAFAAGVESGRVVYYIGTSGGELPVLNSTSSPVIMADTTMLMPGGVYRRMSTGEETITREVPGWRWMAQSGFRNANNIIAALEPFEGQLYASTGNYANGASIYRSINGLDWAPASANEPGPIFGDAIKYIRDLQEFEGQLYASTGWSDVEGQIWRSPDGANWTKVSLMEFEDRSVSFMIAFQDMLFACASGTSETGLDVWQSDSGDSGTWHRVAENGIDSINNSGVSGGAVFNGELYLAVDNFTDGVTIWKTGDGTDWDQVNTSGFGSIENKVASGMAVLEGYLYAGTSNSDTGGQIWRYDGTDWEVVVADGFGSLENSMIRSLYAFKGRLFSVTLNFDSGMQTWATRDGTTWHPLNTDGFGTPNNVHTMYSNASTAYNDHFYVGTVNWNDGGEIWQYVGYPIYLPMINK